MAHKKLGSSHLHEEGDDASPSAGVIFCLLYWYKLLKTSSVYLVTAWFCPWPPHLGFRVWCLWFCPGPPQATEYLE